ncbi:aldehyde dehydrogenase [Rhodococcus sp. ACS1]|uniref:aldehyde dehydrogenase family protein n=1 Tax=Rhodococcus sp. ACS1 TaxID=2028570 RepID=UPI000BB13682|nr:aldehyde dehydrogenase family protein [Rhodococcus sp. ACS1]PBC39313.1 aldehyde dehydrogenase [Rhodococcus sp. ACS1]
MNNVVTKSTLAERHAAARSSLPKVEIIIGDERRTTGSGGVHQHVNPSTGQVQAEIPLASAKEVDEAVRAARAAFPAWRAWNPARRREVLQRFAELVRDYPHWSPLQGLESGMPLGVADSGAAAAYDWGSYAAGWADRLDGQVTTHDAEQGFVYTIHEPVGVVAAIITWNAPLISLAMKIPAALASGNTVVLKPDVQTSFSAVPWIELGRQAGLPDGVLNLVPGGIEAGEALVAHPDVNKISFTGGPPTASAIMRGASHSLTPLVLELGGKGANIIFDDANLDEAVGFQCNFSLVNTGQGCSLPTRLLVQRGVYDEVVSRIEAFVGGLSIGDPLEPGHIGGPVINEAALTRILGTIVSAKASGAGRLLVGGERLGGELADGYFISNTVFVDVDPTSDLAMKEIVGPVMAVTPFDTEADAVQIANSTPYGLSNYLQTPDARRIRRIIPQLKSGTVGVNTGVAYSPTAPYGGVGRSGFGREGGRLGVEEFTNIKTVLER